jgi:hypothetical protein
MRSLALVLTGSAAISASLGLALALAAPVAGQNGGSAAKPRLAASLRPAGEESFPNCPAPAVNGMNIRVTRQGDQAVLTAFVVVQNVGHRAFFADGRPATLTLTLGGRQLGRFVVDRLAASEVRFFSAETRLPLGRVADDLVASLAFDRDVPLGAVPGTQDCQTSDNRAVRRAPSLQASLDRAAG